MVLCGCAACCLGVFRACWSASKVRMQATPNVSQSGWRIKNPRAISSGRGQVPNVNGLAVSRERASLTSRPSRRWRRHDPGRPRKWPRRSGLDRRTFDKGWRKGRQAQVRVRRLSASRENWLRAADPQLRNKAVAATQDQERHKHRERRQKPAAVISPSAPQVKQRMPFAGNF